MKPEAQRIAIAEFCGVTCSRCNGTGKYLRYGKHEWFRISLQSKQPKEQPYVTCDHFTEDECYPYAQLFPDYLNDLNAMHEAESKLIFSKRHAYFEELQKVFSVGMSRDTGCLAHVSECILANAAQRAEALLRTIGKWTE